MILFIEICCIVFILIIIYSLVENMFLKISKYTIRSPKISVDFELKKVLFLSDLHGYHFGKKNIRLINKIKSLQPDLILISGDFITKNNPRTFIATKLLMKDLCDICTVIYSLGNHESTAGLRYPDKYNDFLTTIKEYGVIYLDNQSYTYSNANTSLCKISGLTLTEKYYQRHSAILTPETINEYIGSVSKDCFHILLAHNPECFEAYTKWQADLTLSGHYHGGIIRLPFIGGVISPKYRLIPDYTSGMYSRNSSAMIVSKGLGTHTIHFRLFNRPEINVLQFIHEKENI